MSAKKIKAIRQQLRSHGVDPKDVAYKEDVAYKVMRPQRRLCMGTVTLAPGCGRAVYHAAKERI